MFGDIGWAELLLIGIVALIVIGPEDLPQMFRQVGRFTAKMRVMSRDFSRAMDQAAKESGVKDVTDTVKGATSATSVGLNKVKAAADRFEKWDPIKSTMSPVAAKPSTQQPAPAPETETAPTAEPTIHGPATQELLKEHNANKAAVLQTGQKSMPIKATPKVKSERAMPATTGTPAAEVLVSKPRATKKPKKADEA